MGQITLRSAGTTGKDFSHGHLAKGHLYTTHIESVSYEGYEIQLSEIYQKTASHFYDCVLKTTKSLQFLSAFGT